MDELFGISTQQLTRVLLIVFAAGALILAAMAARDRTSFRMAVRNVPRRKTQTAVIVRAEQPEANEGASFGPGAGGPEVTEARERYFYGDLTGRIRERLAHEES